MKKSFLLVILPSALAFTSCNGSNNQKIGEVDEKTDIVVTDAAYGTNTSIEEVSEENFVEWTKENCGIDLGYDKNLWLPAYFKLVPEGYQFSMYAKDPIDNIDEMVRHFIKECLNASVNHSVGPDPQCTTVDEVLEQHFKKEYKNDANHEEGFCYVGEITYEYKGAKVVIESNFGQYVKSNHVTYLVKIQ